MACIYKIRNIVNGKFYIGSTIRPKYIRKYEHFSALRSNLHYNKYLQNAWNKYGESNFIFELIEKLQFSEELSKVEIGRKLIDREAYFIHELQPEYNLDKEITYNGRTGHKCSEETKNKIRESNLITYSKKPKKVKILRERKIRKGWTHNKEDISKITERSNKVDNKTRIREIQKIAARKRIGTHHSIESKIRIVKSKVGKLREIEIFSKNGELINTCNFSTEASNITGVKRSSISNNLCGLSKSAGNFIFKYKQ